MSVTLDLKIRLWQVSCGLRCLMVQVSLGTSLAFSQRSYVLFLVSASIDSQEGSFRHLRVLGASGQEFLMTSRDYLAHKLLE